MRDVCFLEKCPCNVEHASWYLDGASHPAALTFFQCHLHTSQEGTEFMHWSKCYRIRPFVLGEGWSTGSELGKQGRC